MAVNNKYFVERSPSAVNSAFVRCDTTRWFPTGGMGKLFEGPFVLDSQNL